VFYSWPELRFWLIAGCIFILGVAAFHGVRMKRPLIRVSTRIVTFLTCIASFIAMSLALIGLVSGCNTHSEPLLSPSGDKAARVEMVDGGATGGGSGVAIYSHHGLSVNTVMYGAWHGVDRNDLRWIGDSTLEIMHDGNAQFCSDASGVHVVCVKRSNLLNQKFPDNEVIGHSDYPTATFPLPISYSSASIPNQTENSGSHNPRQFKKKQRSYTR
jgi:hypothetical protein